MNKILIILVMVGALSLESCGSNGFLASEKYLFGGTYVAYLDTLKGDMSIFRTQQRSILSTIATIPIDVMGYFELKENNLGQLVIIKDIEGSFLLRNENDDSSNVIRRKKLSASQIKKAQVKNKFYIFEKDTSLFDANEAAKQEILKQKHFVYADAKPIIQGLTIPLKIRPSIPEFNLPDQAENNYNAALALGYKGSINFFRFEKDEFGKYQQQISFTVGAFLGIGVTSLTTSNTNPIIDKPRNVPYRSVGTFITLGFNNINFGYALGWDATVNTGGIGWAYQLRPWHGVMIGIEIIKDGLK